MPLYKVRRHVGAISQEEVDASSVRAILCGAEFPGMRWHQSYLDRESGWFDCIYEARCEADIREHARISRIPCDEVREVEEVRPDAYTGY